MPFSNAETLRVRNWLALQSLFLVLIPRDGSCLFGAFSAFLFQTIAFAGHLRYTCAAQATNDDKVCTCCRDMPRPLAINASPLTHLQHLSPSFSDVAHTRSPNRRRLPLTRLQLQYLW